MLQPLYKKLFSKTYKPALGSAIIKAIKWWKHALHTSASRIIGLSSDEIDFVIYTDASCEPINHSSSSDSDVSEDTKYLGIIGAVILDKKLHQEGFDGSFDVCFSRAAPNEINILFEDTSLIYAFGLLAVVLTLFELRFALRNKTALFFVDNNAALCALIRGAAHHPMVDRYIATFWAIAAEFNIAVWFERVSSASNIADFPPREIPPPSPCLVETIFSKWNEFHELAIMIF